MLLAKAHAFDETLNDGQSFFCLGADFKLGDVPFALYKCRSSKIRANYGAATLSPFLSHASHRINGCPDHVLGGSLPEVAPKTRNKAIWLCCVLY